MLELAAIYLHLDVIRYFHKLGVISIKAVREPTGRALGTSLIKMMKSNGPSRLPWGTPEVTTGGESIDNNSLLPILQIVLEPVM